jgi:uncharacterized protein YajQ (UPF0234 family)
MTVWELPRNDLAAALEFYRAERKRNGTVADDVIRVLAKLQDDPQDLFQALKNL